MGVVKGKGRGEEEKEKENFFLEANEKVWGAATTNGRRLGGGDSERSSGTIAGRGGPTVSQQRRI
jgi:hypothetical protein